MEYEEYLEKTVLAAKDWVFWYNNQKKLDKELDTLAEPLYNICIAYVTLAGRYNSKPAWDIEDAKLSAERLMAKVQDKLNETKEKKIDE